MPRARLWLCSTVCPTALVLASPYESEDDDFVVICTHKAVLDVGLLSLHDLRADSSIRPIASRSVIQDLTRFAIQAKGPDGKWTRKPLAYRESNNVHLLITRPPEICVNLVFKHIHAASSYTVCRQFVPFIYCPL